MVKATSLLFFSQVVTTILLFVRNVIIARLISVEDFGIAATFSILFTVIELLANLSVVKLIVQDPDGNSPRFQDTLHSVQVLRGLLGAGLTLVLAGPYAAFVNTPDLVWAYQCLAIIPLARAFFHLDTFRAQREMRFRPFALNNMLSPLFGLALILPVWLIQPDYQVMLWSIIGQQVAAVALSHFWAERRFGLAWDMAYVRRALVFGTPLMLNGLMVIVVTNGERMLIANQIDLTVLALFSVAFMLATAATRILMHTVGNLFLPRLSRLQGDMPAFRTEAQLVLECTAWLALVMALGLSVLGPGVMVAMFGPEYAGGAVVLVLLAAGQAVRMARVAPNTISMAKGHTLDLFLTAALRALALPAVWIALQEGYGMETVALIALGFECLSLLLAVGLIMLRYGIGPVRVGPAMAGLATVLGLALADLYRTPPAGELLGDLHPAQAGLIAAGLLAGLAMPRLREMALIAAREMRGALRRRRT